MSMICLVVVPSSGFLSSLIRRNLGNRREMPFSGSTCKPVAVLHPNNPHIDIFALLPYRSNSGSVHGRQWQIRAFYLPHLDGTEPVIRLERAVVLIVRRSLGHDVLLEELRTLREELVAEPGAQLNPEERLLKPGEMSSRNKWKKNSPCRRSGTPPSCRRSSRRGSPRTFPCAFPCPGSPPARPRLGCRRRRPGNPSSASASSATSSLSRTSLPPSASSPLTPRSCPSRTLPGIPGPATTAKLIAIVILIVNRCVRNIRTNFFDFRRVDRRREHPFPLDFFEIFPQEASPLVQALLYQRLVVQVQEIEHKQTDGDFDVCGRGVFTFPRTQNLENKQNFFKASQVYIYLYRQ